MDKNLSPDQRADLVIAQMTLDEKVSLLHGGGWAELFGAFAPGAPAAKSLGNAGYIPGIPRLGIPDLQMADAAVGVTHGSAFGRYSTALPSGTAEASTWDLGLAREYGALIGRELRDQGYTMSLGGGINLTRESRLNDMVHRVLRSEFAVGLFDHPSDRNSVDPLPGFEVAQRVAEQGTVLLKNANGQLPLDASRIRSIAVAGSLCENGCKMVRRAGPEGNDERPSCEEGGGEGRSGGFTPPHSALF